MQIPTTVRIGSTDFTVAFVDREICVNEKEVLGRIKFNEQSIEIRNDCQTKQKQEITFLHELVHGMSRERGLDWGDNDELYTEEIAKSLHQIIRDNPDIFKG